MKILNPKLGPIYDTENYQINGNYEIVNKATGEVVVEDEEWEMLPENIKAEWLGLLRTHVDEIKESCDKHVNMWKERKKAIESQYEDIKNNFKNVTKETLRSENYTVYKQSREVFTPIEMILDNNDYLYELTFKKLDYNEVMKLKEFFKEEYGVNGNTSIKKKPKTVKEGLAKEKYNKEISESIVVRKV